MVFTPFGHIIGISIAKDPSSRGHGTGTVQCAPNPRLVILRGRYPDNLMLAFGEAISARSGLCAFWACGELFPLAAVESLRLLCCLVAGYMNHACSTPCVSPAVGTLYRIGRRRACPCHVFVPLRVSLRMPARLLHLIHPVESCQRMSQINSWAQGR